MGCQVFAYLQLAEPRQVRFLLLQLFPCHNLLSAPEVATVYLRHCLRMRDSCGIVARDLVLSVRLRHLFFGLQPTFLDNFALDMISSEQILISFERPSSLSSRTDNCDVQAFLVFKNISICLSLFRAEVSLWFAAGRAK